MAASGASVPASIVKEFDNLKIGRKYKCMVIHVTESGMTCKTAPASASYADFAKMLDKNLACYGIYDSEAKKKLILVHWNPDAAPVKNRMLVSTTLKAVQDALIGLGTAVQVTDEAELKAACL